MLTRRDFGGRALAAAVATQFTEAAFAQRAAVAGVAPPDTVWLNGNEFPYGPPQESIEAMTRVIGTSNRYHYQEFPAFYTVLAKHHGLTLEQILVGAGSSEILHAAVEAFTSPTVPFITSWPTYEAAPELTRIKGHKLIQIGLTKDYAFDVKGLVAEAQKAGGGLIYICNPNNPTATITPKADIDWLVANLPANTVTLIDEAYLDYSTAPEAASAIPYVALGKSVIISKTFSKIYGMAGLRVGYGLARPDLIQKMAPFRNNVISIVSVRSVLAALDLGTKLLDERREKILHTRTELTHWLKKEKIGYIEPQANFLMIETGRDAVEVQQALLAKGVAVGRRFQKLEKYIRVSIGTDQEMDKFRGALPQVMSA